MFIIFYGTFFSGLCGIAGILYIFYLNFKWGPKLTLVAIPVTLGFFVCCVWLKDYSLMYAKHMLKYVIICLIVIAIFCRFYFEERYWHIVVSGTAGVVMLTMILLAVWMYAPVKFHVSDKVDNIEIQQMSESVQAYYLNSEPVEELMESLGNLEVCGSFREMTDLSKKENIYRLTLRKKNGKEIATYYFINEVYVAMEVGKTLVFYKRAEGSNYLPHDKLAEMYDYTMQLDDAKQ